MEFASYRNVFYRGSFGPTAIPLREDHATGEPYAEERGYTGHEHLTEVRLIHMNGRIFDPVAGRFLQADPLVWAPGGGQSYNRYGYVLNNPLSLSDPSGFSWLSSFIHRTTAQMQSLHGDFAGGWLTRNHADRAAANSYVRMVGAAVAAYYTFGAVSSYFTSAVFDAGVSTVFATVTPHENFRNNLRLRIGWSIDAPFYDLRPERLLSTTTRTNGRLEYRYRQAQDCIEIHEVDPKTRLIVRTDFEGSEVSCIIHP